MYGRGLGLTAVEILIVLALMGTLTAMAVPNFFRSIQESAKKRVIVDLQTLQFQIDLYERMNEQLPESLDDVGGGVRLDHWGYTYRYMPSTHPRWTSEHKRDVHQKPLNSDYDLYSIGPDGLTHKNLNNPDTFDDIVRAEDGFFLGPASEY
ncbi:MAG: hypothetical protein WBH85_00970 [Thermoanaerobaculia bacterium]